MTLWNRSQRVLSRAGVNSSVDWVCVAKRWAWWETSGESLPSFSVISLSHCR